MKIAFIQISGGVGAQIIGCIATKALIDKGYCIFRDGRYFGRQGRKCIPNGITYFDKVLSDSILKFNIFEKNRFICKLVKIFFLCGSKFFGSSIIFYEDISSDRKSALNEAAEYVNSNKASGLLETIKSDLFGSLRAGHTANVVAHVRRGDYIAAGLPLTPLESIFEMVKKMASSKYFDLLIVTDTPKLIKLELINNVHQDVNFVIQRSELLEDLYTLINAETFFASDSQFSIVAIWLSETMKKIACPVRFKRENLISPVKYERIEWY